MNAPAKPGQFKVVGTRPVRPDGVDKVTGRAIYGPDFVASGMLHGAILRSPHAHARIKAIDTRKAEALAGVKAVITAADFPHVAPGTPAMGEAAGDASHVAANCMARGKVLYAGHALAAVAATSAAVAEEAARLIEVEYDVLPHVTALADALLPDAPLLHEDMVTKGLPETPTSPSNAALSFTLARGDAAAAMAGAAVTAGGRFTCPPVHQGYIEPHACVASWGADGQAQIWCSSQGAFDVRNLTARLLGLQISDIRVTPLEIGGGFGGKTTVYLEPVAMVLSRKAGRPVRLAMSRAEVFTATGPAPGAIVDIRLGASVEGKLVAAEIEIWFGAGAFPGSAIQAGVATALGHYAMADFKVTGWDVVLNIPKSAAYRAPGAPQVNFAVESCVDEIARQLGIDGAELRLRNAARPGDPNPIGVPYREIGLVECLEAARAHPHWTAPLAANQGRGLAAGFWFNHGGESTAAVNVASDGSVLVTTGNPDIGGSRASMAIMAAETLGVAYETVRVTVTDTASLGYSMLTGGSRTTFATGKAVVEACNTVIATLRERAAKLMGVEPDLVEWRDGAAHAPGKDPLAIGDIAKKSGQFDGPVGAKATVNPSDHLPGFGVHICDVEVDPETGQTTILRYTAIQDVGRAIHPDYVEGQLQGGAVQGIGWALNEGYVFDRQGRVDNPGFLDYRMPVCSDLPMIDTVMVEVPNPAHPYGVKGVGEVPIVPPLAAVANAVSAATGVRMRDLPLTPDRVHAAIAQRG